MTGIYHYSSSLCTDGHISNTTMLMVATQIATIDDQEAMAHQDFSLLSHDVHALTDDLIDALTVSGQTHNSINKDVALDEQQSRALDQIKIPKDSSFFSNFCGKIINVTACIVQHF